MVNQQLWVNGYLVGPLVKLPSATLRLCSSSPHPMVGPAEASIALWFPCYDELQTECFLSRVDDLDLPGEARAKQVIPSTVVISTQ